MNHDGIQLNEDADTRTQDLEPEPEHVDVNPWYLERDLWGDRGILVFDDTVPQVAPIFVKMSDKITRKDRNSVTETVERLKA